MSEKQTQKAAIFAPKVKLAPNRDGRSFRPSFVIGGFAAAISALLVIWVLFFQSDNNIEIELNTISTTQEGRLELQGLTYRGQTQSGDDYVLNAQKASEDASNANLVNLTIIDGELTNQENGAVTLSSNKGQFDQVANYVSLTGDVVITQSARQVIFNTHHLTGDLNQGQFEAPEHVLVTSPTAQITAEAMSVRDFGDKVIFKGQSKAIIGEDDKS